MRFLEYIKSLKHQIDVNYRVLLLVYNSHTHIPEFGPSW